MRVVRVLMILILVGIVGVILFAGWNRGGPNQMEAAFGSGGKVALDLSAGGYDIRGTQENKIRVELPLGETRNVICRMNVSGNHGKVQIDGPSNNFRATIYIPQKSNLEVNQTIGDLYVSNVEGNKNLQLNIGHIRVEVPSSGPQPSFDGSIIIGALRASSWRVEKGGFFRNFNMHSSSSPYAIKAHVDIGDLEVRDAGAQVGESHAQKSANADHDVSDKDSENDAQ